MKKDFSSNNYVYRKACSPPGGIKRVAFGDWMVSLYSAIKAKPEFINLQMQQLPVCIFMFIVNIVNWNYSKHILHKVYEAFLLICSTYEYSTFPNKIFHNKAHANQCLFSKLNMFLMPTTDIRKGCWICGVSYL